MGEGFADDFEVGAPHVGADVLDGVAVLFAEGLGEPIGESFFVAVAYDS